MFTDGYDSTTPSLIPRTAPVVFPYADGRYRWSRADCEMFPDAYYRAITVEGNYDIANIGDVEPGCIWPPGKGVAFVNDARTAHPDEIPALYCDRSTASALIPSLSFRRWHLFLATLDGTILTTFMGKTVSACQFWGGPNAPYDRSAVFDLTWLHKPGSM